MQTYNKELLKGFKVKKEIFFGKEIEIKSIPDDDRIGALDKRELLLFLERKNSNKSTDNSVEGIRRQTGFPNLNLNTIEIITDVFSLEENGKSFRIWYYFPRKPFSIKDRKAIFYIHGGSWFAGSVYTSENFCKLLAEKCNAVVFNIEYALAPENPFPIAFNQIIKALNYIYENSETFNIDKQKITIMGDSCGGELAAAAVANIKNNIINSCVLIYPSITFDFFDMPFEWKESDYKILDEYKDIIIPRLGLGRSDGKGNNKLMELIRTLYCQNNENLHDTRLSPLYANLKDFPKTLIITAEFDGLRPQGEYFAAKLSENGVNCKVVRYSGVHHGFIDKLGVFPQTEDAANLISEVLN